MHQLAQPVLCTANTEIHNVQSPNFKGLIVLGCGFLLYLLSGRNPTRIVPMTSHVRPMIARVILQEHKREVKASFWFILTQTFMFVPLSIVFF